MSDLTIFCLSIAAIVITLTCIHSRLVRIHSTLLAIAEQIADVTTEDYRHLLRIRTTEDP